MDTFTGYSLSMKQVWSMSSFNSLTLCTGVNSRCPPMAVGEETLIKQDPACKERVLLAYEMMLDFYGMKLVDRETGQISRAENALTGTHPFQHQPSLHQAPLG